MCNVYYVRMYLYRAIYIGCVCVFCLRLRRKSSKAHITNQYHTKNIIQNINVCMWLNKIAAS